MIKVLLIIAFLTSGYAGSLEKANTYYSEGNERKAKRYYKRACREGIREGCKKYEQLLSKSSPKGNIKQAPKPVVKKSSSNEFQQILDSVIKAEIDKIRKPTSKINLVRDEFETTSEFNQRVKKKKQAQQKLIEKYTKKVSEIKRSTKGIKVALQYTWGKPLFKNLRYDADNGYFTSDISFENKPSFQKKVAIKIERAKAKNFKRNFNSLKPQAVFDFDGKSVHLKDIRIPFRGEKYIALFTDKAIDDTRLAVNIDVSDSFSNTFNKVGVTVSENNVKSFDTSRLVNLHELDRLLDKSKAVKKDKKKWLFVIGIEKYDSTANIAYATRSAKMFTKSVQKKLGVLPQNSYVLLNGSATQAKIKIGLKKLLRKVKMGDTIYFYYNGHGIPIASLKNEPYMLPSDSEPDYIIDEKFFSLKNIYGELSKSKASKVVAFVDSCFSGVTDGKAILKGVAAARLKAKKVEFDKKKMVVISAGQTHQYSNGYNKKQHRLFSFFVIKNIIEGNKDIRSLYKQTKSDTYNTSLEEYGDLRVQDPSINGNSRMSL